MKKYWRVYPTEPVKGYTHTYIEYDGSDESCIRAYVESHKMERFSGVKWNVELVER